MAPRIAEEAMPEEPPTGDSWIMETVHVAEPDGSSHISDAVAHLPDKLDIFIFKNIPAEVNFKLSMTCHLTICL